MKRGEILKTMYELGATEAGVEALEKGTELVSKDLNAMVNAYGADLPLLVACIKGSMPHWERHLGEAGMEVCRDIMRSMMVVDGSGLRGMRE